MAEHFRYYDDWKSTVVECAQCEWKGTFYQGSVGYFDELMDTSCPVCDKMLAVVPYPTIAESEQNWDRLTDQEKQEVSARKKWLAEWDAASLKSVNQLPELEGNELSLEWDMIETKSGRKFTIIRYRDREVWRELASWEGYNRFRKVAAILKEKYGQCLVDVVPTAASALYLYGDKLSSIQTVEEIRQSLKRCEE